MNRARTCVMAHAKSRLLEEEEKSRSMPPFRPVRWNAVPCIGRHRKNSEAVPASLRQPSVPGILYGMVTRRTMDTEGIAGAEKTMNERQKPLLRCRLHPGIPYPQPEALHESSFTLARRFPFRPGHFSNVLRLYPAAGLQALGLATRPDWRTSYDSQ